MLRALLLLLLVWTGNGQAQDVRDGTAAPAREVAEAMRLPAGLREALAAYRHERALPQHERVQRLIDFMMAEDGLALRYQEQPTFGIAESHARRRVNCLSFTMMFIALARASGMRAYAQASDDALAMRVQGDIMYRATHVNAGIEVGGVEYTIDVGWRSLLAVRKLRTISDAQLVALLHNNNAVELLLSGDREQAEMRIQAALALDPASATILSNAGVLHWRAGRRDAAERTYLQALKLKRDHLGALGNLVVLYRETGATQPAESYTKRLRRAQAADPFSQFLLAKSLADAGAYDDAVAHYRRAVRLLPDEPQFHRSLADAYLAQGKAQAAARARRHADKLEAQRAARQGIRESAAAGQG